MGKFTAIMLYILWIATIIAVLAATFTNFEYEDLNMIAFLLLAFSALNTFLSVSYNKQNQ